MGKRTEPLGWQPIYTPFSDLIETAALRRAEFIKENREKFVEAWIAETGALPSECMLVEQHVRVSFDTTIHVSITRKTAQTLENERLARERQEEMSARQLALYSPERWSEIQRTLATLKELLNASA